MIILCAFAALSACDGNGQGLSINASIDGDNASAATGSGGNVSFELPGFSAKVNVPEGLMDKSDFDIDGVKLYPGARVTGMNVNATGGGSTSIVKIAFAAPDAPAKVRDWYENAFAAKSIAITRSGEGLAGKTADGDGVLMAFAPSNGGGTTGTIDIRDSN